MNKKHLQYFLLAYETKNIQRVAELLFISRQGASKIIRELERELGSNLFIRSAKGLEPTDFARTLFPHAKKLLEKYEYITGINTLAKQKKSVITIYTIDNIVNYLSADFFKTFRQAYPDTILSIIEGTDDAALNSILLQNADFAISTGPIDETRFAAIPLFYTRYCIAMSNKHPLAHKECITYQELHQQMIISKGRAFNCFRSNMEQHILSKGINVDIFAEITNVNVALDLVEQLPLLYLNYDYVLLKHQRENIILKYLQAEINGQNMYLITLKDIIPRKVCREFQQFLLTWLKKDIALTSS